MAPKSRSTRRSRATPDSGAAPSWPRRRSQRSRPPTGRTPASASAPGARPRRALGRRRRDLRGGRVRARRGPPHRTVHHRPPADGEWTVPPVVTARHAVPDDWRFLLVRPTPTQAGAVTPRTTRCGPRSSGRNPARRPDRRDRHPARAPPDRDRERRALRRRSRGDRPAQRCVVRRRTGRGLPPAGRRRGRIAVGRRGRVRRRAVVVGADRIRNHGRRERDCGRERRRARALDEAGVDGSVSVVEAANGGARVTGRE